MNHRSLTPLTIWIASAVWTFSASIEIVACTLTSSSAAIWITYTSLCDTHIFWVWHVRRNRSMLDHTWFMNCVCLPWPDPCFRKRSIKLFRSPKIWNHLTDNPVPFHDNLAQTCQRMDLYATSHSNKAHAPAPDRTGSSLVTRRGNWVACVLYTSWVTLYIGGVTNDYFEVWHSFWPWKSGYFLIIDI